MILILGLGNPGKQYEKTWHNTGFMAVDFIAGRLRSSFTNNHTSLLDYGGQALGFEKNKKTNSLVTEINVNNKKIIIAKPLTYMNNSGKAVRALIDYYKINKSLSAIALATADKLIVIYDEIDLPFGTLRVRSNGSSAGHKGVQSIIDSLGTDKFWRVRLGIRNEKTELTPVDKFVLQKFSRAEYKELKEKILPTVLEKVLEIIT